jgi:hypothetical protein
LLFHTNNKIDDGWYIDSEASRHMTPNQNILNNIQLSSTETIVGANDGKMSVIGEGNTTLKLKNFDVDMNQVLLVPELGVNLLSVNEIVKKGNTVVFNEKGCTINQPKKGNCNSVQTSQWNIQIVDASFEKRRYTIIALNDKQFLFSFHAYNEQERNG